MSPVNIIKMGWSKIFDIVGIYDNKIDEYCSEGDVWLIAMYHRIVRSDSEDPFNLGMCVNQNNFEEQLIYLKNNFECMQLGKMIEMRNSGHTIDSNVVSITFDDGYKDNLEIALPLLKKHGIPATIFVSTGGISENEPFWWDRLINAIQKTKKNKIILSDLSIPSDETLSLSRINKRQSVIKLQEILWRQPLNILLDIVKEIELQLEVEWCSSSYRVSYDDIIKLHREGIEIASHTVNHANLTLMTVDEIISELEASKMNLENVIDAGVTGFACPGGRENDFIRKQLENTGYKYAVTTIRGLNGKDSDKYGLFRIGMPNTSVSDFKRCLSDVISFKTTRTK